MILEPCGRICQDGQRFGSTKAPQVDPLMDRSSKAITLALIGSSFLLGGCGEPEVEEEDNNQATAGTQQHHGGGVFIAPRIGGGMGGGVATSPSARGGFGSTGSASAST
jgi:hypothetical protein